MSRRRMASMLTFAAVLALMLIAAPVALAAAGSGSSGFGGGGGGGGEGGGGGGRGVGVYILLQLLFRIALLGHGLGLLVLIALALTYLFFTRAVPGAERTWQARRGSGRAARRRVSQRQRRVETAAAEAAEDDPGFAGDAVKRTATELFVEIQRAWDAQDRIRLRALVAPGLLAEWERRLDDFARRGWRNRVAPLEPPNVEYVSLVHRGDADTDRVVVRIEARMHDYVQDGAGHRIRRAGRFTDTVRVREYWTLGRRNQHWILLSIEQGAEGEHALSDEIVASPWADTGAMRDEALVEGAMAEAVPQGTDIAELTDLDFQGDARAAALDLSLADGRFAPDVLEVAARRAVAAWTEAVDGDDDALLAIAHADAAYQLLHPGDPEGQTRLVVRGPSVGQIRILSLDPVAKPPTMTIEVDLKGRRYLEDRATAAVVAGSQSRLVSFTERWTLALDGDSRQPWRIASVSSPLARR